MKIINFGSLNVDYVYKVKHIVQPGETIAALGMQTFPGGKGANQSVAMARAGAAVWHAGLLGTDTQWLREMLSSEGINVDFVHISSDAPGGNAIIQVDEAGMNSIIVLGGTNQAIKRSAIDEVMAAAEPGDWLSLQNEINLTGELLSAGKAAGLKVCLNPSPITPDILSYPLDCVDLFVVNELEAASIAGMPSETAPEALMSALTAKYPAAMICITLGSNGALFCSKETGVIRQHSFEVKAVDTTAAGDTFTGYLIAGLSQGCSPAAALERAAKAAAISVTRMGAIPSIPQAAEL